MPQYEYKVKKGPEEVATGVMEAESKRAAVARLREMGYFPISIEEHVETTNTRDMLRQAMVRIKLKDRNVFFRQLANLTEAGMPITRALYTISQQTENPKLKDVVEQLRDDVQKGASLADAMERHPKLFPAMLSSLVRAGESGGMLEDVLWRVVTFGEQEEELQGKAISALIYPIFLLLVSSSAIFILVSFVFPKFIAFFKDFNAALPWPTLVVMGLCDFMGKFWWAVLIAIGIIVYGTIAYVRTPGGREQRDRLLLRWPIVRRVVQGIEMARFARTLGTLLDNGVPVLTSLRITQDTLSNVLIAAEVAKVHARVTEGDSISESLSQASYFTPLVVNMFAVGEESGRLGAVTRRIADAYDNEVDRAVKAMAALFEPLLIVIMGIIVGFLVIAMLLPMLTLSSNIS